MIRTRGASRREGGGDFATDRRANTIASVRRPSAAAALVLVAVGAGCGAGQATYPPECSDGPQALRAGLTKAPDGPVTISGVKLSDCMAHSGDAGPLETFGGTAIDVATGLIGRARQGDQRALVQLGYLRGALRRGANPGLHDELLRRFDQELLLIDTHAPAFTRGQAAGRERG
jgi:hypothetical protein